MGIAGQVAAKAASRIKFPKLLALFAALWLLDMFIPDPIPFFDEIMLALATAIFGLWRERVPTEQQHLQVKDVTPSAHR
ncbi:MAG: DUF6116 family protein [Acidobacteriota bacterium]